MDIKEAINTRLEAIKGKENIEFYEGMKFALEELKKYLDNNK